MKKDKDIERPISRPDWNWPLDTIDVIDFDPLGSYTGFLEDRMAEPVQDADDL